MAITRREKKVLYADRLKGLVGKYKSCFVVNVDNVKSSQMHQIRRDLRSEGSVALMGKNTLVRKVLGDLSESHPGIAHLAKLVKGNVGLVFTNGELKTTRDAIVANRVQAPAKTGSIAPIDVIVPAGNTGLDPSKAQFFLALGIPRKINRGTVEITEDVHLIKPGDKVGPSQAELLNMLNISPFTFGMSVNHVFDEGNVFSPSVLDVTEEGIMEMISEGIGNIAAVSLASGYTTKASVAYELINAYQDLIAISVATDYTFEGSKEIKEFLANPEAFASVIAAAAPAAQASAAPADAGKKEAVVEEEEESDEDMGFGLFD